MNNHSNPVGPDEAAMTEKANGRRRLVRGAVALAPVVLTLRSGALAAASCTGAAKVASVTLENNGKIPVTTTVEVGDGCFTMVSNCENQNRDGLSTTPGKYTQLGKVKLTNSGRYKCTNGNDGDVVAILSSTSVASFK